MLKNTVREWSGLLVFPSAHGEDSHLFVCLIVCLFIAFIDHLTFFPTNVALKCMLSPTPWLFMPSLSNVLIHSALGQAAHLCVFMQKTRSYHQSMRILITHLIRNVEAWHTAEVGRMKDEDTGGLGHIPTVTPGSCISSSLPEALSEQGKQLDGLETNYVPMSSWRRHFNHGLF